MRKRSVISGVVGAALAMAGTVAVTPSAAQAAWTCQQGYVCFYENYGLSGSVAVLKELSPASGQYTGQVQDFRNYTYTNGKNLNDSASSVINLTGRSLRVYSNVNYNSSGNGGFLDVYAGESSDINYKTGTCNNDAASSARFY
ncbi:peptidase inhibitor family I36 protein [Paractinoplanes atraurantiacus]|uniref:Peptidase inhibitor family I36 n=1 Tax=Paractinoplanes atraurantiacus TaxID=1036182 RepID=A0A285GUQ2_9ACTN|nr:peptidase inhibitor family I36 protein [Actinoplanes atraurantiacus]SNY26031.1 Peptidase inhibitor family I36 [Actinoplanes atraurantiacus]